MSNSPKDPELDQWSTRMVLPQFNKLYSTYATSHRVRYPLVRFEKKPMQEGAFISLALLSPFSAPTFFASACVTEHTLAVPCGDAGRL